MEASAE